MGNNRKPTARFQEGSGASLGAPELVRLSKRMSELGLASRREADAFIEKGWVLVDGKVAQLGEKNSILSPCAYRRNIKLDLSQSK